MKKKPGSKSTKITKGAPSGFVLSLMVHAAAFMLAGMLVVFNVVKKEEKKFVPPKPVDRPKMKLKKPKVKIKKSSKPKATNRIVTKVKRASMPDIQLPEMSGITAGLGGGMGGFDIMPDLSDVSVLGSAQSIGNDFVWPDVVYRGLEGNKFRLVKRDENIYPPLTRFTMTIDSGDIDNDLDLELYYGNISSYGTRGDTTGLDVVSSIDDVCEHTEKAIANDCKYFNQLTRHAFQKGVDISDCQSYKDIDAKSDCLRIELIQWARRNPQYNQLCYVSYSQCR